MHCIFNNHTVAPSHRQLYICIIIPFSATNPPLDEDPAGVLYHLCGLLLLLHWSACSFALVPGPHPSAVHATPSPHGKLHNVLYYDVVFISTTIIIYPLGPRPPPAHFTLHNCIIYSVSCIINSVLIIYNNKYYSIPNFYSVFPDTRPSTLALLIEARFARNHH